MTKNTHYIKPAIKKLLKVVGIIIGSIILLVGLLVGALNLPPSQQFLTNRAESFINKKIKPRVDLGTISVRWINAVKIKDLLVPGYQKDTMAYVHSLYVRISLISLLDNTIDIRNLKTQGVDVNLYQAKDDTLLNINRLIKDFKGNKTKKTSKKKESAAWKVNLNRLILRDIGFTLDNNRDSILLKADLQKFRVNVSSLSTDEMFFDINKTTLHGSNIVFKDYARSSKEKPSKPDTAPKPSFKIASLDLSDISFSMENATKKSSMDVLLNSALLDGGTVLLDSSFVSLDKLTIENIQYYMNSEMLNESPDTVVKEGKKKMPWIVKVGEIDIDESGIDIFNEAKTRTSYNPLSISKINTEWKGLYFSDDTIRANINDFSARKDKGFNLKHFSMHFLFAPDFLHVKNLNIEALNTDLNADIHAQFPPTSITEIGENFQLSEINLNANIDNSKISKDLISQFVELPNTIKLPSTIYVDLEAEGSMDNFIASANIKSWYGNILTDVKFTNTPGFGKQFYTKLTTSALEIGEILQSTDTVGALTSNMVIKGEFIDTANHFIELEGVIDSLKFRRYNYSNLELSGQLINRELMANLEMNDDNVDFEFSVESDHSGEHQETNFLLDIDYLNLYRINLMDNKFALRTKITGNITGTNMSYLQAVVNMPNITVITGDNVFDMNQFKMNLKTSSNNTDVKVQSDIISGNLSGNMAMDSLISGIKNFVYDGLYLQKDTSQLSDAVLDFEFTFSNMDRLTSIFLPELEDFELGKLKGEVNVPNEDLNMKFGVANVVYKSIQLDSFKFHSAYENDTLYADARVIGLQQNQMEFDDLELKLYFRENEIINRFHTLNKDKKTNLPEIKIAGKYVFKDSIKKYHLFPGGLVLNGNQWNIDSTNEVIFLPNKTKFTNLDGKYMEQSFSVNTTDDETGFYTRAIFNNLRLKNFTSLLQSDTSLIGGTLDGEVKLYKSENNLPIDAEITIENLHFRNDTIDAVTAEISRKPEQEEYQFMLDIGNKRKYLMASGEILTKPDMKVDAMVEFSGFDLEMISPYIQNQVANLKGTLTGKIDVEGGLPQPNVNGDIKFNNVEGTLNQLGLNLNINNETIWFSGTGVEFNRFEIQDDKGNSAYIDGTVRTDQFKTFSFDLDLNADNLRILSSDDQSNQYYGTAIIDADVSVNGSLQNPDIDARLTVDQQTNAHFVMLNRVTAQSDEGIVRFVSLTEEDFVDTARDDQPNIEDIVQDAGFKNISVNADIEIEEQTEFTIVLDPVTRDRIEAVLSANLSYQINPNGISSLTGRAAISGGKFHMTFANVSREFIIESGMVQWRGEVDEPQLQIEARYTTRAAPIGLFSAEELPASEESALTRYKQRIPFSVFINLSGDLDNPDISFDLSMPNEYEGILDGRVAAKLAQLENDESEENKQAVALLVLGSFMGGTGQMFDLDANYYKNQLISEAINFTADRYIDFVNLNFDLQSYNTYGETEEDDDVRTDLEVEISRKFLNEKLVFNFGGVVLIQGDESEQQASLLKKISPEAEISYYLSEDRIYQLNAFSETEYTGLLDGKVRETGVSIVFNKQFTRFENLFKREKEENYVERRDTTIDNTSKQEEESEK